MWRNFWAVVAGAITAMVVVVLGESAGHWLVPPPPGMDASNLASVKEFMPKLRPAAFLLVLLTWFLGSFAGSTVAAFIARTLRAKGVCAWIIGGLLFAFGAATMVMLPHPLWFIIAAGVLPFAGSWLAGRLAARRQSGSVP